MFNFSNLPHKFEFGKTQILPFAQIRRAKKGNLPNFGPCFSQMNITFGTTKKE